MGATDGCIWSSTNVCVCQRNLYSGHIFKYLEPETVEAGCPAGKVESGMQAFEITQAAECCRCIIHRKKPSLSSLLYVSLIVSDTVKIRRVWQIRFWDSKLGFKKRTSWRCQKLVITIWTSGGKMWGLRKIFGDPVFTIFTTSPSQQHGSFHPHIANSNFWYINSSGWTIRFRNICLFLKGIAKKLYWLWANAFPII